MITYMRDGLPDDYGILQLQDKILEIVVYIDQLCREHEINYCLMGGSALGAKRHGGFIPWDDDLDIFMSPDSYEKFRKVFFKYGHKEKYYLQEYGLQKNGMVSTSKLRMNGTTYIEELVKNWNIHQGIFVDIFILHTCPANKTKQLWQCFWAKCVVVKGMSMRNYSRQHGMKQLLLNLSKLLPKKIMIDFALRQVYRFRHEESDLVCHFLGKALYKRGIYQRKWFEHLVKIDFEKVMLNVPDQLHEFLVERFGNYMAIPSADRIMWEQHAYKWDTEKSFEEYCNARYPYKDEINLA